MLDRELSPVREELEISFGTEPAPSNEEIWSEVDQALMDLDDGMGPLDVGGYDIRYLFPLTSKPRVNISTVPYFNGYSKNLTVIRFSTPENVLFTCQHENCACSENIIDEPNAEDVYTTWLLDSGASMHFMPNQFNFTSYEEIHDEYAKPTYCVDKPARQLNCSGVATQGRAGIVDTAPESSHLLHWKCIYSSIYIHVHEIVQTKKKKREEK